MSAGPKVGESRMAFGPLNLESLKPADKKSMTKLNTNLGNTCPTLRRLFWRIWAWALVCSQGEIEGFPSCPGVEAIWVRIFIKAIKHCRKHLRLIPPFIPHHLIPRFILYCPFNSEIVDHFLVFSTYIKQRVSFNRIIIKQHGPEALVQYLDLKEIHGHENQQIVQQISTVRPWLRKLVWWMLGWRKDWESPQRHSAFLPLFGFKSGTVSMLLRATSDHDFGDILRLAPIRLMASGCTTSSNRRGGGVPDGSSWTDATTVVVRQWQMVPLIFWMWIR